MRFSVGLRTTVTTITAAAMGFKAGANEPIYIREVGIELGAATASVYGLGRAANGISGPTVQTSATTPVPMDGLYTAAPAARAAVTWSTAPTVPTGFMRRIVLPAQIGAGVVWPWDPGVFRLNPGEELVLWNITANSAITEVYFDYDL